MTSKDTLLHTVLQFVKVNNKMDNQQITQLQALKIYLEMIKAR